MKKIYIVRLSDKERAECEPVIKKLKGSSTKVRRAQILLKVDINGSEWTDKKRQRHSTVEHERLNCSVSVWSPKDSKQH